MEVEGEDKGILILLQERFDFAAQNRELSLDDVPHELVVYIRVAVNEDVTKGYNAAVFSNAFGNRPVELGELCSASPMISN
jgi:hypothetical protein